jgi:hypothetical protein
MADPVKPDLSPIAGGSTAGKAVATGAAKAAAIFLQYGSVYGL